MNASDPNSSLADWRRHLAELPECAPDESVWRRLQAARAAGSRVVGAPQRRYGWAWATAAAVLMAVTLVSSTWAPVGESGLRGEGSARVSPRAGLPLVDAGLLQLDADIERAYGRGADESEIASLWATRQRVASSLESSAPVLVARL